MTEEELFVMDTMTWSFSRLNSYYNCAYEWYLHYLECNKSENGFFGEYGSFIHKILEKYISGELSLFDLNQYYEENFNESVPHDAPPNKYVDIRQSYYDKGIEYLNNIDLDLDRYEILGVEKEIHFTIEDKDFVGYIDLLVKDRETDEIIIIDHKSASIKILKNGSISKTDQKHFLEFKRQLYLYSIPIVKEYGSVSKLKWNMFKDQKWIEIPWKQEEYDEAIQWAKDTLKLIENESLWLPNQDYYYCNYLCGQRNNACEFKPQPISKKSNDDEYYNPNE
ncbi:hypothetical protein D7V90_08250 [bacterium 1xD42-87]|nr:hypothetical protein D7V90_08250 [bacterium 1xD42-87]